MIERLDSSGPGGQLPPSHQLTNREAVWPAFLLLLGLVFGLETWLDGRAERQAEEYLQSCRKRVQDLAGWTEPQAVVRSNLLALIAPWATGRSGAGAPGKGPGGSGPRTEGRLLRGDRLARAGRTLRDRWGFDPSIYVFDRHGRLAETWPRSAPNLWLMRNLFPVLVRPSGPATVAAEKQVARKIPFVFGDEKNLSLLRGNRGRVIETFSGQQVGSLLWTAGQRGGVIVHCPRHPDEQRIFQVVLEAVRFPARRAGFGSLGTPELFHADGSAAREAVQARLELNGRKAFAGEVGGSHWVFQQTTSGRVVWAAFPPVPSPSGTARLAVRSAALVVLMVLLLASMSRHDLLAGFGLRRLFSFLFAGAGLVPLIGLALGSLDLVRLATLVTGNRMEEAQIEALTGLARDFDEFVKDLSTELCRRSDAAALDPGGAGGQDLAGFLRRHGLLKTVFQRDAGGNLVGGSARALTADEEALHRSMAREAVHRFAPGRLDEVPYQGNAITDKVVQVDDMGFRELLNWPNLLQLVQTGQDKLLLFFRAHPVAAGAPDRQEVGSAPLPPRMAAPNGFLAPRKGAGPRPTGRSAAVAYTEVRVPLSQAVQAWLRTRARSPGAFEDLGVRLCAFDVENQRWAVPPPAGLERSFRRLARRAWMTGQAHAARFRLRGGGGFVTTLFSAALGDHCLAAFCSDVQLVRRRRDAWDGLWWGVLVFTALSILLVQAVGTHLVTPLRELECGAEALRGRRFDFRLKTRRPDELGRLFRAFDEMMNGSQDLQVARRVQEGLIPREFPQPEGFSIAGRVLMASDLGGDILNCLPLPDGRIAFLAGDVSGHGVGSALMMAFARAVAFHWSRGPGPTPASLAQSLDRALREQGDARAFMGVVCGILDPGAGRIELTVQGHVFPLLIRADGTQEWVGEPAYPLGIHPAGRAIETLVLSLGPGDGLLCATDGFIEARPSRADLRQVGYEQFARWARETRAPRAGAWLDALLERHSAWAGEGREDDVTLFLILRREVGEA